MISHSYLTGVALARRPWYRYTKTGIPRGIPRLRCAKWRMSPYLVFKWTIRFSARFSFAKWKQRVQLTTVDFKQMKLLTTYDEYHWASNHYANESEVLFLDTDALIIGGFCDEIYTSETHISRNLVRSFIKTIPFTLSIYLFAPKTPVSLPCTVQNKLLGNGEIRYTDTSLWEFWLNIQLKGYPKKPLKPVLSTEIAKPPKG